MHTVVCVQELRGRGSVRVSVKQCLYVCVDCLCVPGGVSVLWALFGGYSDIKGCC